MIVILNGRACGALQLKAGVPCGGIHHADNFTVSRLIGDTHSYSRDGKSIVSDAPQEGNVSRVMVIEEPAPVFTPAAAPSRTIRRLELREPFPLKIHH